jgi:protocatechuate 3,4-dioxygenase beta subunit
MRSPRPVGVLPGMLAAALVACDGDSEEGRSPRAASEASGTAAADCRRGQEATPEQTEGPYYKPGPPRRRSLLERGVKGRPLVIRGRVLSSACRPRARARVDFWQADGAGDYDNSGYRLRGYQLTDRKGRYRVRTVVPARYEGRTRHIHVKVTPRGGETLTTQLYFPREAANRSDPIFAGGPLLRVRRGARLWRGAFDFVVR